MTSVDRSSGQAHERSDAELLEQYRRDGDQRARDELAERYMPLARRLAMRYRHTAEPLDDLIGVANMALVKAIDRFDPERGAAFSSFAVPTILGELKRHFRDHAWSVHVPRDLQERSAAINKAIEAISNDEGHPPTVRQIAEKLDLSLEQVLEGMQASQAFDATSLDMQARGADPESPSLHETLGKEDPGFEMVEYGASIEGALEGMPERTRTILHLRFVEDRTQIEIAEQVGVSQMQVSRLIRSALSDLRKAAEVNA